MYEIYKKKSAYLLTLIAFAGVGEISISLYCSADFVLIYLIVVLLSWLYNVIHDD